MPDIRDYNLNRWGFVDDSGTLITIASSNVSIDELNSILGTINIVPNDDNYVLMVNGREAGVISITSQLKLKNVVYNPDTQSIEFTFESDEGEKKVSVDVHELVDVYTAGQGLGVDKNQFFIKIDPSSEKYLSVSENGIKISGLDTLLKNLNETLANFGQETAKAFDQINNVLETSINTINGGIDNEIRPAITKNEESITALQEKVDGIVVPTKVSELENDAQYQNADEVDAKISAHIQEAEDKFATKDELTEETNARTVKDTQLQNDLQLEAETARTAEKANADAISAINEVLPTKVEYTDVATSENPGRKAIILKNHDTILGNTKNGTSVNIAMVSKWDKVDLGSAQVSINLNGKDERPTYNDEKEIALLEDVQGLGATIVLEKTNDLQYTLKVGDAIVGTIDIPKDQFVKSVSYNEESKTIDFVFETTDGEQTVTVNVSNLVDTYTAGNGISLTSNEFSLKIDATTQQYIEVSAEGLKIVNIDEKLAEKVGLVDIATKENPNRKAIVLKNHDTILGTTTEGATQNLIMMSKWNKVDVGTTSNELNLNGSAEHPTYNDEKELAFVDEIPSVEGLASEEWVNAQGFLKEHQDISHLAEKADLDAEIEARGAADTQLQADLESEAEARKIADDEIKLELEDKVEYTDISDGENPNRKTIQLNNHDTISGIDTSGVGYNLAMISKWNKADFGSASIPINLNGSEKRPTYNDDEEIALMKDIEEIKLPIEFNFPIRTLQDKVYTQKEIFGWFGVADAAELKGLIVREGQFYLKFGIQLSGNPYYYKMPIQYIAFESANQIKMVVIGLDTTNDMPTKYEIIINLDGTIAEGNSNIKVTSNDLAFASDTPSKVSELENDAQYQTSSEVDARIQAVVGAAPEALDTLEEIANKLSDNDDVVGSLTTQIAEKATTEALNAEIETRSAKDTELQGNIEAEAQARIAKDTEIETELANKVAYTDVTTEENPNRKAIVLNNHDTLLGNTTSGRAVNIAMVSKWDKVDLGSTQVSLNLNGKDERPTYNDDAELALLSDVQAITVPTKVSELENDSLYQTKDEVDAAIATKAEQADVDKIKDDLEQFKAPYQIDLNALNSAGDADSEAISTAIGGIDNLRAVISENRSIIGDINNGTVPVSIRILGNITTVYYVLDSLAGYTLNEINIQNTSGTLAKNSVTHSVMSEEMVVDNLTSNEATLPLSAKQGKVLDEKIQKKGMYYPGVKVDTQKLFALTKESSGDEIKAALQLKTASGSYTLPTAEILDDCLGKGYQLLSNWMPVSVVWNGAAYVLYIVGQNYMMQPTGLYTVSIRITDGVYSVFQAAKVEEFANIDDLNKSLAEYQKIDVLTYDDDWNSAKAKVANGVKTIVDNDGLQWTITLVKEEPINETNTLKVIASKLRSPYSDDIDTPYGFTFAQFTLKEGAIANSWSKVTSNGEFISEYTVNNLIDEKLITVNNAITLLNDKVSILENKYNMILEENSESVADFVGGDTINDTTKSYSVSNANIESNSTINAKNIVLNDSTLSNNARLKVNSNNIEVNNLNISGNFPKENGNSVISLNDADYVVFKDMIFNSNNVYNGVEIGLNSEKLPKNILFENCKFEGTFSNNAILVFGTQNDATITLSNCTFDKLSNALRLSNKSNASGVTVNIINCSVNQWEETNKEYGGFLICEDYTSDASSVDSNNLFGNGKITVNFMNLTHKGEKVIYSNASRCCGTKDENQVVYVYADNVGFVNYSEDKYPIVTFK